MDILRAAQILADARAQGRRIVLPAELRPRTAAQAYAVQDEVARLLGKTARAGWKVGAPDGRTEPTAAPIFDVLASPARINARGLHMIGVEAEIAVVFKAALPPRASAYTESEVMAALDELCVAIEVCDSRLADWESAEGATKLADHQLNFALVRGSGRRDYAPIDCATLEVRTWVNGALLKQGTGTHAVGNPLGLLPWLANHARERGGLAANTVVTTGAWLGMHMVEPAAEVVVEFPAVGRAQVSFPA
ncbi:MAG: fumarylacetoacetate hydrolase family protein [Burkholderiales bacterium]|nr:fumarylacetoacetate hydrolase family protein [Burkholderiales bacterium]